MPRSASGAFPGGGGDRICPSAGWGTVREDYSAWNERDPILKERLFVLSGHEGNHGEDVKEACFYLDNTPTHAYMRALYKYPHRAFPYADLVNENVRRTRMDPEYELVDTGAFAESRYFDVLVEYAKADPTDIIVRVIVTNRGPQTTSLHVLPTLWFRNTWSWGLPCVFSFYEYFHGDTGRGCGASHQTGWTSLIANLLAAGNP